MWPSQELDSRESLLERNRPTIRFDFEDADGAQADLQVEAYINALLGDDDTEITTH